MTFKNLISHPAILSAIEDLGHTTPTPIQQEAIPHVKNGLDLRASAQTGTGKTAAFLLPILERVATATELPGKGPRCLILVPTRELAMQVAEEAAKYSKHMSQVKTVCIYGGAAYPPQNKQLSRPYEILVATPGRLIDHISQGRISFSRLEVLVLDEADRMLDMGFIHDVEKIAEMTPKTRQTLLFSATLKGSVLKLSRSLLKDPVEVKTATDHAKHENIEQKLVKANNLSHKFRILDALLTDPAFYQVVVFTSTKRLADELCEKLLGDGQEAAALHSGMRQRQRTRTITDFKENRIRVLVATDVAARGIDVPTVSHVVNFDLPMSAEDYVHRIGRTGRAGAKGIALSFATSRDMSTIRQIERFTGQQLINHTVDGVEAASETEMPSRFDRDANDRRPSQRRSFGSRSNDRPARRPSSDRRPRESSDEQPSFEARSEERPARRQFGEKRSFEGRSDERPRRPFGEKRPFEGRSEERPARRQFGEKRPFEGRSDERPARRQFGDKPSFEGRDERPARRQFGDKPSFEGRSEERPARRPFGEKRPFEGRFKSTSDWKDKSAKKPYSAKGPSSRFGRSEGIPRWEPPKKGKSAGGANKSRFSQKREF